MSDRTLLDRKAVAARLGHTLDWFYQNKNHLVHHQGFPDAVLGGKGAGARWDPAAIDAWLDARLPPKKVEMPSVPAFAAQAAELLAEAAELDRRSAELAAGGRRRHG